VSAAKTLHVSRLKPHPANVRDDLGDLGGLTDSIRAHGILQPLVVEPQPLASGQFIIIAGHRRYAAAKRAGLDMVPVVIRDPSGAEPEELMLVENLQRADLNPIDKAHALGQLRAKGYTVARIAASIGLSDASIYSYLTLLELDRASQDRVRQGTVSAADAIDGVRRLRKRDRKRQGKAPMGPRDATWEPDHFTSQHPLARKAKALCEAREHALRRRVGKVACGQCWETVIRADERIAAEVLRDAPARQHPRDPGEPPRVVPGAVFKDPEAPDAARTRLAIATAERTGRPA
jgi:ParB family transcriptional regulator, chromosome partitioning protein